MIENIARRLKFPQEAIETLLECEEKMQGSAVDLERAKASLYAGNSMEYLEILEKIANDCKVDRRECDMVFLLLAAIPLEEKYNEAGYSSELFEETMADLRFKLYECKYVFGVWGTFVTFWFKGFYRLERFKLGRMQYERIKFPFESYKGIINKGDTVLSCHIPTDGPMPVESIKESLRMAYDFYKDDRKDGKLAVMCFTWLLYPPIFENYKEGTNIKDFYRLFDIIESKSDARNPDFVRVFGVRYSPEVLDSVPVDNSLRLTIRDHLKAGGTMGTGSGIIIVDENY